MDFILLAVELKKESVQAPKQNVKATLMCCKLSVAGMPLLLYTDVDLPSPQRKTLFHAGSITSFAT